MRSTLAFVVIAATAFSQLPPAEQRVADLTELIARKPDFASAYYARGVTRLSMRQYPDAEFEGDQGARPRAGPEGDRGGAEMGVQTKPEGRSAGGGIREHSSHI